MGYVTKEQIERARQTPALDYVLAYESNSVKRVGSGYRFKDHESLAVSDKGFYWHSHGIGGKTALDYLTNIRGYGLVEAVCTLIGERPYERGEKPNTAPPTRTVAPKARAPTQLTEPEVKSLPERLPFSPPLRNKDNKRVIAYLQSRGIDRDLILDCIKKGSLYESAGWHNCVFVGRDENGKARFAAMRGTMSSFKRDADGSDKSFGFVLPPLNGNSDSVAVFEAPIDALSHQMLCPGFDGWRLSLGCTALAALTNFLERHGEIKTVAVCTDNDEAGNKAAINIAEIQGISTTRILPPAGHKDWNDALQSIQKTERLQNKTGHENRISL